MKVVVIGVTDPAETAKEGARRTRFNRTSLLRARQEFREAVVKGAAEADRGELIDGEQVFKEIEGRLWRCFSSASRADFMSSRSPACSAWESHEG